MNQQEPLTPTWSNDSIFTITLSEKTNDFFYQIIHKLHNGADPYSANVEIANVAAYKIFEFINSHLKEDSGDIELYKFFQAIESASLGKNLPPIIIKNGIKEPKGSLIPPPANRGFDYGENAEDRMKEFFYTEWFAWIVAVLLNHDNIIHPSEHGGKNRFHAISPRPGGDEYLRNVGASTGGGEFKQHNDSTVYNNFKSKEEFLENIRELQTDIPTIIYKCEQAGKNLSEKSILEQVLSGKYICVDALTLTGVLNVETHTHIGTPTQLQSHLFSLNFTLDDVQILSKMPVAHFAGPADGEISNFLGTLAPPIAIDNNGLIVGTNLNAEENRMIYVGSNIYEEILFKKFIDAVSSMPLHKILLNAGELLFIPNTIYGVQQNVTHGREVLSPKEYNIDIGKASPGRRHQSRQYTSSRHKNNKSSFLSNYHTYYTKLIVN